MSIDRRQAMEKMLGFAGMAAGVGMVSPALLASDVCPTDEAIGIGSEGGQQLGNSLLTYAKLDPIRVARHAYAGYARGGCMYGVFDAIVKELASQGHEDACRFSAIPTNITVYGGGGVNGWGSICGCVNASAMAVNMLAGVDRAAVIDAVFRYYEKTPMPRGDSDFLNSIGAPTRQADDGELLNAELIGQSVANSILCHTSVTNWSAASKFGAKHAAKLERCAQITAEIAFITVEFLNQSLVGTLSAERGAEGNVECAACHKPTALEPDGYVAADVNAKVECQTCHSSHEQLGGIPEHADDGSCNSCHK
ncbi:cytochrome C [Ferrimonas sediminicola]|uniref:Cytochrome C n=1 Tax=Ferrimonas sediminicola TaxID=2569538 RepID=A0A4U1BBK1_9GAMM|nr:C-GCAxxG-C-C family (seleno)protein [Ferrimonas sediminicola]TKB48161.1 cytochrome C [Ferrimonas sediminicola]